MTPVKLDTDVLVLGGGSGGLCAAMAAREAGARVTLVYKTGGNATAVAAGGYAVVLPDAADDSADHLMADALRSGAGLVDQTLLRRLARIAKERGCGRLEWSCLDWNRPSIQFYLSLGARPMEDWTCYRLTGETLDKAASEG